ncbi:hypothetical protein L7F22_063999 [Adiantum nelumboides]|nr:hypothetical protein [Adiantum nelumboides]
MSDTLLQIEKDNRAHEKDLLKMKLEEETKWMETYMHYELDIAKALKSKFSCSGPRARSRVDRAVGPFAPGTKLRIRLWSMAFKHEISNAAKVARLSIETLGRGYDLTCDLRFSSCKDADGTPLIEINDRDTQELTLPGGVVIENVPAVVKSDKGERTRFRSDILTFDQMSQHLNQELSLSGKIPCGLFNYMFNFSGQWQKDALTTKHLALDGWFYTLYTLEIPRAQLVLKEDIKALVPASWEPAALARFIETFGTHIIVSVKIGGKDVIYMKQHQSSPSTSVEFQKLLAEVSDERFMQSDRRTPVGLVDNYGHKTRSIEFQSWSAHLDTFSQIVYNDKHHVTIIPRRKGGIDHGQSHSEWIHTVPLAPDMISVSLVPISFLLSGVAGSGFLSHAVNLYLRYKPPVEELRQFLEFQLPREWAPVYSDLPLTLSRKDRSPSTLQFTLLGPKLKVSKLQVTVGKRPVTGMRLYLEGKKCDKIAIHLQHLTAIPRFLQPLWEDHPFAGEATWQDPDDYSTKYFEPVQWKNFSHVCTAPVENTETWIGDHAGASVVVGAQLAVKSFGLKNVLYLRLLYSRIPEARIRRSEWDHMPATMQKSGMFSTLFSTTFSSTAAPVPSKALPVVMNSGIYPDGPPKPVQDRKLLRFVDTTEMTKGPQDMPGHWLVTGAKLYLDRKRISMRVKYSLLTISSD